VALAGVDSLALHDKGWLNVTAFANAKSAWIANADDASVASTARGWLIFRFKTLALLRVRRERLSRRELFVLFFEIGGEQPSSPAVS
jgi:hypothetical protein